MELLQTYPGYPPLSRKIGTGHPTFIIVEVGSTHCASLDIAKQLIDAVKTSGADCVKFQKRHIPSLLTKEGRDKKYTSVHAMADTYGEHRELMEFNEEQFLELQKYSIEKDLFFTASGWDFPSVDFLAHINVPFLKVASADLTNLPLLTHIARKQVPVFLSTGMADIHQVRRAFDTISRINPNIALLQCTSSYPAPLDQVHLNVLHQYREQFPKTILGYSGHELGIEVCLAAVAMGANIIEKHLTLNKMAKGTDHSAALDPKELEQLVKNIRIVEQAMGSFTKTIQPSEKECIAKLTKSLTSTQNIQKGQCIHESMLTTKSPGSGISPLHISTLVGLVANQDIPMDTTLTWNMFV